MKNGELKQSDSDGCSRPRGGGGGILQRWQRYNIQRWKDMTTGERKEATEWHKIPLTAD